jgi:hypothetical protein
MILNDLYLNNLVANSEPSTLALLVAGFGLIAAALRRIRSAPAR